MSDEVQEWKEQLDEAASMFKPSPMRPTRWESCQEMHTCGAVIGPLDHGMAVAVSADGGAGPFLVLSCNEVAFDSAAEFDAWASSVRKCFASLEDA